MQEIKAVGWEEWLKDPILSGPYRQTKSVPGERKEFEVNVDWWKKPAPDFEKQILMQVPEAATRLAMVASKQADVMTLSALTLNQALQLPHVKILQQPATIHMQFYFFNMLNQDDKGYDPDNPFYDVRVREAFNIAVNREALVNTIYAGLSEVQNAPMMATGMRGWDHPIVVEMRNNPIPFDVARAKQLLQDANFDFDETIPGVTGRASAAVPEAVELIEAVANQWITNLGVKITLEDTQEPVYAQLHDGEAVRWLLWGRERIGGAGQHLLGPARYFGPGSVNFAATHWDRISVMRENALGTTDLDTYNLWNATISKFIRDEAIMVNLFTNPIYYGALKDRVESWPMTPGITREHYMEYIRATEALRKAQ
jgi:ABC-type transport system substrate-binding protein